MPQNDIEVFEHLIADPQAAEHIDYLSYAIYTHEKYSWINHFTDSRGRRPTQGEIDTWISNLTDQQLERFMRTAAETFDQAARAYLAEEIATEQDKVFQRDLLSAVRTAGSLRRQVGLALFTSILTPIILGLAILALSAYKDKFPAILTFSN